MKPQNDILLGARGKTHGSCWPLHVEHYGSSVHLGSQVSFILLVFKAKFNHFKAKNKEEREEKLRKIEGDAGSSRRKKKRGKWEKNQGILGLFDVKSG